MATGPQERFVKVPTRYYEALIAARMPGRHKDVMHALTREIFGYHVEAKRVGANRLARLTGIDVSDVRRSLKDLDAWSAIHRSGGGQGRGNCARIEIVKDPDLWEIGDTSEAKRRASRRQKTGDSPPVSESGEGNEDQNSACVAGNKEGGEVPFGEKGGTDRKGGDIGEKKGGYRRKKEGEPPPTKDRKREERVMPATPDPSPLLRLLCGQNADGSWKLEGEPDEKAAWLASGEEAQIEVDAAAGKGTVPSLTIRYYRAYLRQGQREFRGHAARQAKLKSVTNQRATSGSDPPEDDPAAANHPSMKRLFA